MTILEEIVQIVPTLSAEDQRQLLDLATRLRDARTLPDITRPPTGPDAVERAAWRERQKARSAIVLEEEKRPLMALGLVDEHWRPLTDELPDDMRRSSGSTLEG